MTNTTKFMLNILFSMTAGYPEHVMAKYADVFKQIIDLDKELLKYSWDSSKVSIAKKKYFG